MKKSLRNLAKVAAGLGAAYALTKMGKSPAEGDTFGAGTAQDYEASKPKDTFASDTLMEKKSAKVDTFGAGTAQDYEASRPRDTFESDTLERGSVAAFKQDEANRQARIAAQRLPMGDRRKALAEFDEKVKTYNRSIKGAKKGKMMMASKGGSVIARGNKIARSKPTKLF